MKPYFLYILIISILQSGCNNPRHQDESSRETTPGESSFGIELNDGVKWKINDEMKVPIKNMERHLLNYNTEDVKDYKVLAEVLQGDIKSLTSSCTMTGKSHDELHKWLLPFMEFVNQLSEAENDMEAAGIVENIEASMNTYNQFFQ